MERTTRTINTLTCLPVPACYVEDWDIGLTSAVVAQVQRSIWPSAKTMWQVWCETMELSRVTPIVGTPPFTARRIHYCNQQHLANLAAGNYTIWIKDLRGCTGTKKWSEPEPDHSLPALVTMKTAMTTMAVSIHSVQVVLDHIAQYRWKIHTQFTDIQTVLHRYLRCILRKRFKTCIVANECGGWVRKTVTRAEQPPRVQLLPVKTINGHMSGP